VRLDERRGWTSGAVALQNASVFAKCNAKCNTFQNVKNTIAKNAYACEQKKFFLNGMAFAFHTGIGKRKFSQERKRERNMAIFTRPSKLGGKPVEGHRIECQYNGKPFEGMVISQRKIEGKGNLLTVETANGFRSIYFEKASDITFYSVRRFKNTDDGYDAKRDRRLELYGI